ncbi:DegT/DnrJ/EryC1/StrS family aminotransferase [Litorivicinus sp.]|nr:DegT/DnrJ/EryC1/StrS family aminotransferase [Litorivicinus sp.]
MLTIRLRIGRLLSLVIPVLRDQVSYYPVSVRRLEERFARLTDISHCIMFSNATSATEAALFALGIDRSCVVGTPAFVIPSSYCSAAALGARIEFIDVSRESLNLDVELLQDGNPLGLDALIVTHFYGNPCDMPKIMHWANEYDVKVIEDCSHAHGARVGGRSVGAWGHVGVFSLQGAKAVSAGEGGIATTNDSILAWKMAAYGHQQSFRKFSFGVDQILTELPEFGFGRKMRAHPLGAVLALVDLNYLDKKNRIFARWVEELNSTALVSGDFYVPRVINDALQGGYCQGVPLVFNRVEMAKHFVEVASSQGIGTFMRSYSETIEYFTLESSQAEETTSRLQNTYELFDAAVFIPFLQFVDFRRWQKLLKILRTL